MGWSKLTRTPPKDRNIPRYSIPSRISANRSVARGGTLRKETRGAPDRATRHLLVTKFDRPARAGKGILATAKELGGA